MPQDHVNLEGRRRGARHNTCEAKGQKQGTGLVNGPVAPRGYRATVTTVSESRPAAKPQRMVNGYTNYRFTGKSTEAARKGGSRISAVADASAAGWVSGISVKGVTNGDADAFAHNCDQMTAEHSLSAATKNKRRRKKFRSKMRDTKVVCPENCEPPFLPPQEENWENQIQDITVTDWDSMCLGVKPYGPEDVLHFALRDLTLKQRDIVDLPVTATYSPAVHHPHPVQWFCCSTPTEPGQFADAEELCDVVGRPREVWLLLVSGSSTSSVT